MALTDYISRLTSNQREFTTLATDSFDSNFPALRNHWNWLSSHDGWPNRWRTEEQRFIEIFSSDQEAQDYEMQEHANHASINLNALFGHDGVTGVDFERGMLAGDAYSTYRNNINSKLTTSTPTQTPTQKTKEPTPYPTHNPSIAPTTNNPTQQPTNLPTSDPTLNPTTNNPTTAAPTHNPTLSPTTNNPTNQPTDNPTLSATSNPTQQPTSDPTTNNPTTASPTHNPTFFPNSTAPINSYRPPQITMGGNNNSARDISIGAGSVIGMIALGAVILKRVTIFNAIGKGLARLFQTSQIENKSQEEIELKDVENQTNQQNIRGNIAEKKDGEQVIEEQKAILQNIKDESQPGMRPEPTNASEFLNDNRREGQTIT